MSNTQRTTKQEKVYFAAESFGSAQDQYPKHPALLVLVIYVQLWITELGKIQFIQIDIRFLFPIIEFLLSPLPTCPYSHV